MQKAFKRAAAGLALCAAFAAGTEWAGHLPFDRTGDALCKMDRSCRVMTPGEIAAARTVFGDTIDYNKVKIFARPWFGVRFQKDTEAMAPNGNVYLTEPKFRLADFSGTPQISNFIHELVHVWQHQHGVNLPAAAIREALRHKFNYNAAYAYNITPNTKFSSLGIEQQATLVESYVGERENLHELIESARIPGRNNGGLQSLMIENCRDIKRDEAVIRQALPLTPEKSCPLPPDVMQPVHEETPAFSGLPQGQPFLFPLPPPFLPPVLFPQR